MTPTEPQHLFGTDRISIRGIRAEGIHGVLESEHHQPQDFIVDVSLTFDARPASRSDDIRATIDYSVIADKVMAAVRGQSVALIERLAYRIAMSILEDPRIFATEVTGHKPQAPLLVPFEDVSTTIYRSREDYLADLTQMDARLTAHSPLPRRAVLGLGANLGDPVGTLRAVVQALRAAPDFSDVQVSPLARTRPVLAPGQAPQPDYYNAVVQVTSQLSAKELLDLAHFLEDSFGRERPYHWAPRTLDVDIIWIEGLESLDNRLLLPHPRAVSRAFVMVPWARLDPEARLGGHSVAQLAQQLKAQQDILALWEDWLEDLADATDRDEDSLRRPGEDVDVGVGEAEVGAPGGYGLPSWKAALPEGSTPRRIVDDPSLDILHPADPEDPR